MNIHRFMACMLAAGLLAVSPLHAHDHGRYPGGWSGGSYRSFSASSHGGYGYQHTYGGRAFWGPFGLIVGSALLYSALQPRTVVTYESRTIYTPPPVTMYYAPAPVVRSYEYYGVSAAPTTVAIVPAPVNSYPVQGMVNANVNVDTTSTYTNVEPGPGASGAQWWYLCRNPAGYYPRITECLGGWEKVLPAPPP